MSTLRLALARSVSLGARTLCAVTVLACASRQTQPTTPATQPAASAPVDMQDPFACPLAVAGSTVAVTWIDGGVDLLFQSPPAGRVELEVRVHQLADLLSRTLTEGLEGASTEEPTADETGTPAVDVRTEKRTGGIAVVVSIGATAGHQDVDLLRVYVDYLIAHMREGACPLDDERGVPVTTLVAIPEVTA